MSEWAIIQPLLVEVLLTFLLALWLGVLRARAVAGRMVRVRDIVLGQKAWPGRVQQVSNSFQNQFEVPVLFYLVVVLAIQTGRVGPLLVGLAWGFVVLRLVHAAIHVTTNKLRPRFMAFLGATVVLAAMWLVFALGTLTGGT